MKTLVIDRSTDVQSLAFIGDDGVEETRELEGTDCRSGEWAVKVEEFLAGRRPDRIVVGEVRSGETLDMLQAMNTGHSGMSTGHANSTVDMLSRMETMVLLGSDIPLAAVRRQIASAVDIIIQLARFRDKSRKVSEITEITGYENGEVTLNCLYRFVEEGEKEGKIRGTLKSTGSSLKKREKLKAAGLD